MSIPVDRTDRLFTRAEDFIWKNARLLDRRLFEFQFKQGPGEAVLTALRAYQNEDGGFGNALEPDIRCPDSQPVPVQHALEIMDAVRIESEIADRAGDFLMSITTDEGGVPFLLPSAHRYPRAPWWNTEDPPPASLNPTAAIAGLMHKNEIPHRWLERATDYCWRTISGSQPDEMHVMGAVITFLQYAQDRERAERELRRLGQHLLTSGLVADVQDAGYVRKPLDWAPTPDHPLRGLFSDTVIQANLDELIAGQQEDGGWGIAWEPVSLACEREWRGWVTRSALLTLRANGRLRIDK